MLRRIALLSVHTCPLAVLGGKKTGGMNVYVRELSRELGRRGIKVDVFTRSQNPCIPHVNEMLGENARVIHIPTGPEAPLDPDEVFPYLDEFVANVLAFAERDNVHYDLVYSHYWLSGWAAQKLRAAWDVPVVQMFHTLGRMKARIAHEPAEGPVSTRVLTETEIMTWADKVIAATPAERAQLLWLYRVRRGAIEVIPPGVDLVRFHPTDREAALRAIGCPASKKLLLFVGRIEPLKGIDTLFEALALLKRQFRDLPDDLVLSIIGGNPDASDDPEMERLKERCRVLGLADRVVFLGAKDQDVLNKYYAAAEALIMPSDYESFGMVALEAMACGTPVIASEVGGLAFLVQDGRNGYLVPVREPAVLADRIRRLLQNPEKRAAMARYARLNAEGYGWPHIANRLLAVFEELLPAEQAVVAT